MNAIFRFSACARAMIDRNLVNGETLNTKQCRQKTMHALVELNAIETGSAEHANCAAYVRDGFSRYPIAESISDMRADFPNEIVLTFLANTANHIQFSFP